MNRTIDDLIQSQINKIAEIQINQIKNENKLILVNSCLLGAAAINTTIPSPYLYKKVDSNNPDEVLKEATLKDRNERLRADLATPNIPVWCCKKYLSRS